MSTIRLLSTRIKGVEESSELIKPAGRELVGTRLDCIRTWKTINKEVKSRLGRDSKSVALFTYKQGIALLTDMPTFRLDRLPNLNLYKEFKLSSRNTLLCVLRNFALHRSSPRRVPTIFFSFNRTIPGFQMNHYAQVRHSARDQI